LTPPTTNPNTNTNLNLNTTITLSTWLKAKDAANANDKKIVQLEQELRELQAKDVANANDKKIVQLELQAQELQAKDAANAKDKKIVQLEQELHVLSDLTEVVLKQNEANEAKKRAKVEYNRIYQINYKKSKSMSNALLQRQQVPVCADPPTITILSVPDPNPNNLYSCNPQITFYHHCCFETRMIQMYHLRILE
jgi:hypothetical protein